MNLRNKNNSCKNLINTQVMYTSILEIMKNRRKYPILLYPIKFSCYLEYWLQIRDNCYFDVLPVWHAVHYSVHARYEDSRYRLRQNNIIVSPKMLVVVSSLFGVVFYKPFRMI